MVEATEDFYIPAMADESDRATMREIQHNHEALEEARRRAVMIETHPDFDGKHCLECDEDIPAERLAMGKIRCVRCQGIRERAGKRYS